MAESQLTLERLIVSSGAVVTPTKAAQLLGGRVADARRWLERRGLIRYMAGKPRVRWMDVLDALDESDDEAGGGALSLPKPVAEL